ncbi:MAG TPA: hypothetical protein VGG16_20470 [Streptosporangiaceae bacterium]
MSGWRGVPAGMCRAWSLPADETCAGIARRLFREAVAQLGLEEGVLDDAILMASELAANTMHASEAAHTHCGADTDAELCQAELSQAEPYQPEPCQPELWLYLRGVGLGRELVCKLFDCYRGWLHGPPPPRMGQGHFGQAGPQDVSGRGLQIVHELSGGRWGHHLTRARLAGEALRGKAVWFAVPAPMAHARLADVTGLRAYTHSVDVSAAKRHEQISARQAARELTQMLDGHGLEGAVSVRTDAADADMSVLSVGEELTLWFGAGSVSLTGVDGERDRWRYTDLVEAAEQTIRRFEELRVGYVRMAAARFA